MNKILIRSFLSGWFDRQEQRLAHRSRQDAAINGNPVTQRVTTMKHEHWGLM